MKKNQIHLTIVPLLVFSSLVTCYGAVQEVRTDRSMGAFAKTRENKLLIKTRASTVASVMQCASKFDEYGDIRGNDTKTHLDNFAIELQNNPQARAYMLFYGPRRGRAGLVQRRRVFERGYLVNARGISPGRVVALLAGYKEDSLTELWVVPPNCAPPNPSPTVPQNQVVFLIHPEVGPERLALIQALVRDIGPIANPILRHGGDAPLDEWNVLLSSFHEQNGWGWVELDQDTEITQLKAWALLRKVGGRWRTVQKKVAQTDIQNAHRQFIREVMTSNPGAPREIFNN